MSSKRPRRIDRLGLLCWRRVVIAPNRCSLVESETIGPHSIQDVHVDLPALEVCVYTVQRIFLIYYIIDEAACSSFPKHR